MSSHLTLEDLRRWEDYGATWRSVVVADDTVTVQLCTCFGEPVELARGEDADLIGYVRTRQSFDP